MKIKVEGVQYMLSVEAGKYRKLKSDGVYAVVTFDGFTVIDDNANSKRLVSGLQAVQLRPRPPKSGL
jgi:hypothetical protein